MRTLPCQDHDHARKTVALGAVGEVGGGAVGRRWSTRACATPTKAYCSSDCVQSARDTAVTEARANILYATRGLR
eukprot:3550831-Prymnesium_polylepis.1